MKQQVRNDKRHERESVVSTPLEGYTFITVIRHPSSSGFKRLAALKTVRVTPTATSGSIYPVVAIADKDVEVVRAYMDKHKIRYEVQQND